MVTGNDHFLFNTKSEPVYELNAQLVEAMQQPDSDLLDIFTQVEMKLTDDQIVLILVMITRSGTGKTTMLLHRLIRSCVPLWLLSPERERV